MLTRRAFRRERLKAYARHPLRSLPDLRQHARGALMARAVRMAPLLRRLAPDGWAPLPGILYYAINAPCNLSCFSCDAGTGEKSFIHENLARASRPRLSLAEFSGILDSVKAWRPEVFINAMEPLLTPDTPDHIRAVTDAGLRCTMNTNGTLLEGKAGALIDAGLRLILVSLDGQNAEVNDPIRGEGAFDRTVKGIRALGREKEARGSHWPEITLCATMSERNIDHLEAIAEFALELPVQVLVFQHLWTVTAEVAAAHNRAFPEYPVSAARSQIDLDRVDTERLIATMRRIRAGFRDYPVFFSPGLSDEELRRYYDSSSEAVRDVRCPVMWQGAQIVPNGDVMVSYVCPTHTFGNLRQSSLRQIWNGPEARAYRRRMSAALAPRCTRCHDIYAQ